MERLTKRELKGEEVVCNIEIGQLNSCPDCNDSCMYGTCKWQKKANEKLKHYEDLEEQGVLHKAEIKDGTPIWYIASLADGEPFLMKSSYIYNVTEYEVGSLEKDFWLSEEEAFRKLKELENV